MKHRVSASLLVTLLVAGAAVAQDPAPKPNRTIVTDATTAAITGVWRSDADPQGVVSISGWGDGQVSMRAGKRFDAVGYLRAGEFIGLTREPGNAAPEVAATHGIVRVRVKDDGTALAEFSAGVGQPVTRRESWRLEARFGKPAAAGAEKAKADTLPAMGDYVQVEELPEVLSKFPPEYPEEAKRRKIEGTVMVQALVGKDGGVKDAVVVRSIPELNDAATECVRLWRFRPARNQGQPVAVWVAIPVTFRLK